MRSIHLSSGFFLESLLHCIRCDYFPWFYNILYHINGSYMMFRHCCIKLSHSIFIVVHNIIKAYHFFFHMDPLYPLKRLGWRYLTRFCVLQQTAGYPLDTISCPLVVSCCITPPTAEKSSCLPLLACTGLYRTASIVSTNKDNLTNFLLAKINTLNSDLEESGIIQVKRATSVFNNSYTF